MSPVEATCPLSLDLCSNYLLSDQAHATECQTDQCSVDTKKSRNGHPFKPPVGTSAVSCRLRAGHALPHSLHGSFSGRINDCRHEPRDYWRLLPTDPRRGETISPASGSEKQ